MKVEEILRRKFAQSLKLIQRLLLKSSVFYDTTLCSPLTANPLSSPCQTILFKPKHGGKMFLRNDGKISTDYMVIYLRR